MLGRAGRTEEDPNLAALRQEIKGWLWTIESVRQEFRRPNSERPSASLFLKYRNEYADLANRLSGYLKRERQPYYETFRRSQGASNAVKRASEQARALAGLFSKYQNNPKQFDWVKVDGGLYDLYIALENLSGWL